jgi:glyoxylase-like metal-dependent hydrolase (beta-lactamase superfamily II)
MSSPSVDAADLSAKVFIGPFLPFERGKGTFAATTSTLVCGASEALLIDAQHIRSDVAALGDMIARTGRRLTTIYVTHGQADHWYGAGELVARFPGARVVATGPVLEFPPGWGWLTGLSAGAPSSFWTTGGCRCMTATPMGAAGC